MAVEELKGHLDLVLLAALTNGPAHGYALIEEVRERSGGVFDLPEGSVYPALYRLEAAGLLASRWTTASGRRRRTYRLTAKGRRKLERERGEWRQFSQTMSEVVA
jgi:PadR family transcriptional regulator, regulatory protein PadR